jgi:opacity protein-like surface antigen
MKRIALACLGLFFLSQNVLADSFEFGVSNTAVNAAYNIDLSKSFQIRTSFIHADNKAKIDFDNGPAIREKTKTDRLMAGIYNGGSVGPVYMFIGGEAFWLQTDIDRIKKSRDASYGLAIGAGLTATIVENLFAGANVLYSPDILNNGDHQSMTEFNARIGYRIFKNTSVYGGYRYLGTTGKRWDLRVYNGMVLGFSFDF